MSEKKHLPLFGIGPLYALSVILLTVLGILFFKRTDKYILLTVIGIIFIIIAVYMWIRAVIIDKIDENILQNKLVIKGIYAWVRNPIYAAIAMACTGVLYIFADIKTAMILPLSFWLIMTVMMKNTEEKWLLNKYGIEYEEYCRRVNRCIPFIPEEDKNEN